MKNIFKIKSIFWVVLLLMTFSCQDILDEDPPSNISLANFYQSEGDAVVALVGAYNKLYNIYDRTGALNYGETIADNLKASPVVTEVSRWDDISWNNNEINGYWSNAYSGINRANEVILYTEDIPMDAGRKADIIAEAKALRALYYFNLARLVGGVPIYEEPTVGFEEIFRERATEEAVYNLVVRDWELAASELEGRGSVPGGRINADIVNSLLARLHLYRGNYSEALARANLVINSGNYDLFADYNDIFRVQNNDGTEHIFQLHYSSVDKASRLPDWFGVRLPPGAPDSFFESGIVNGAFAPSAEFVADMPVSYRRDATIADSWEHIDGSSGTVTLAELFPGGIYPYYISKFDDRASGLQSGLNFTIFRYADILLIAAEAMNEVDASNDLKYTYINAIRERARNGVATDLPDLAGLSQDQFRDAVLEERRFELAFEGERAWDLKRRGLFISTMTAQGKMVQPFQLMFPIPNNQIIANPNLTQNEGW